MPNGLKIGDEKVYPGERKIIQLPVAKLYDSTEMKIPIEIIRGQKNGPILLVCSAIHGDEINGVETVRRLLKSKILKDEIRGTVIAVPIVNVYAFNNKSRYLPDRRDLNRCFPGSQKGSLGSRLAHVFMKEIVSQCTHVLDLHTGSVHRFNIPQVRGCLDNSEVLNMAKSFGAKIVINSNLRDGSLRQAVTERGIPALVFEGGEALRFEPKVIKDCLRGIFSLMKGLKMIKEVPPEYEMGDHETYYAGKSLWIRSSHSGILTMKKRLGTLVKKGELLATVSDPYGKKKNKVISSYEGIVIGQNLLPLVTEGDALFHIGLKRGSKVVEAEAETDTDFYERDE